MYGVGVAAAVASFDRLRLLALECGWSPRIAWLLAVCIDLYAITATRRWLRPGIDPKVRHWAGALGWACVALSVAGNTVQHALSLGYLRMANGQPSWIIVVIVAAVPPVMLASLVHVESTFRFSKVRDDGKGEAEPTTQRKPQRVIKTSAGARSVGSKRRQLEALLDADPPSDSLSAYAVAKKLAPQVGLNVQAGSRYVREWRGNRSGGAEVVALDAGRAASR